MAIARTSKTVESTIENNGWCIKGEIAVEPACRKALNIVPTRFQNNTYHCDGIASSTKMHSDATNSSMSNSDFFESSCD